MEGPLLWAERFGWETDMGMILRFPIERIRPAHASVFESEESTILILPAVRIEREKAEETPSPSENDTSGGNAASGRRRRAPRH
jgi:hypothetical protein